MPVNIWAEDSAEHLFQIRPPEIEEQVAEEGQTTVSLLTTEYVVGEEDLAVYINGERLLITGFTEVDKATFTLTSALTAGDTIQAINGRGEGLSKITNNVLSVAGRAGHIILTKEDVGLDQVDNTSDADKPLSALSLSEFVEVRAEIEAGDAITITTPVAIRRAAGLALVLGS